MSDRKILSSTGWGDGRCKCTLKDAVSARHCRYCDPQATIDDLLEAQEDDEKDFWELYEGLEEVAEIACRMRDSIWSEEICRINSIIQRHI